MIYIAAALALGHIAHPTRINATTPGTSEQDRAAIEEHPMTERPTTTVARWNKAHPVGTPVRVWTGAREGDGLLTRTRSAASVLGGHTAVVWVDGEGACIALSHVDPDHSARFPALAVPCPACQSPAGQLCTSHSGTRVRRNDVHQDRTKAHAAAQQTTTAP